MAKIGRILKDGAKMDYVATGAVANGDVVVVGANIGLALGDAVLDDVIALDYSGTIEVTGTTADAFVQGQICYWDTTNEMALTANGGSDPILGMVLTSKASATAGVISVDLSRRA